MNPVGLPISSGQRVVVAVSMTLPLAPRSRRPDAAGCGAQFPTTQGGRFNANLGVCEAMRTFLSRSGRIFDRHRMKGGLDSEVVLCNHESTRINTNSARGNVRTPLAKLPDTTVLAQLRLSVIRVDW